MNRFKIGDHVIYQGREWRIFGITRENRTHTSEPLLWYQIRSGSVETAVTANMITGTEPKFKVGDRVIVGTCQSLTGTITEIHTRDRGDDSQCYQVSLDNGNFGQVNERLLSLFRSNDRPTQTYVGTYRHDDATWTARFQAYDFNDAESRAAKLNLILDGCLSST
ncbi:MAG: hypothetical protein KGL39_24845 [Patescibacteria group bacterium]|nr:hypothetical protein [Patescibacteria group bacterium]